MLCQDIGHSLWLLKRQILRGAVGVSVQSEAHLGRSTMPGHHRACHLRTGLSSKSSCNPCVALGVQGAHLASAFPVMPD